MAGLAGGLATWMFATVSALVIEVIGGGACSAWALLLGGTVGVVVVVLAGLDVSMLGGVISIHSGRLVGSLRSRWGGKRVRVRSERLIFLGEGVTDDMLLAGFGARDPVVSRAFVMRFQRVVFGAAVAVTGDLGLAEDVAQESFVRALVHAEQYDPRRGTVRSWLMTIARNLAVDALRERRARPVEQHDLELLVSAMVEGPEYDAWPAEASGQLRRALAGLPSAQARAAVLTAVHGLTAAELAEREAIPLGSAESRIRAALTKLHATMSESGGP